MPRLFVPESLTVALGPNVFQSIPAIDLGGPCVVQWTVTALALDPDGLTVGAEGGDLAFDVQEILQSADGVTTAKGDPGTAMWYSDVPYTGGPFPHVGWSGVAIAGRYFHPVLHLCDGNTLNTWAGGSHPTAVCRVDVGVG